MKAATPIRIVIVLLLVAAIATAMAVLPAREYLGGLLETARSLGPWGPVVLAGAYVLACVLFVPGSMLTLGAGFLFGLVPGTIAVSLGSVLGATAAFLIGRTLLRDWIERRITTYPRFQAIDRAIGREGFKIVLLARLSPIFPFNLLNYAFGLTNVRLWQYVLASWIGMLPGTIMYVYLGSALKSLAEVATGTTKGGLLQTTFFVVGLIMTVAATVVVTRVAKRALNEAVEQSARVPSPDRNSASIELGRKPVGVL